MDDNGKSSGLRRKGKRNYRYLRKIILERDSPKTRVTFRDVKISQWESRRPERLGA